MSDHDIEDKSDTVSVSEMSVSDLTHAINSEDLVRMLHNATEWDNVILLSDLLGNASNTTFVNCQDVFGRTLVYKAVVYQSVNCLRYLLEHKADANIAGGSKTGFMTPMHHAVAEGKIKMVEILLEHNTSVEILDGDSETPLRLAKLLGNAKIVAMIQAHEEKRRQIILDFIEELNTACVDSPLTTIQSIISRIDHDLPTILNTPSSLSYTSLSTACRHNRYDIAEYLIAQGATAIGHPQTLESPLHIACRYGGAELVELLVKTFPTLVTQCTIEDQLPLHIAAKRGVVKIIKALYTTTESSSINTYSIQEHPKSPITYHYHGSFDVNFLDHKCRSPLYYAVVNSRVSVVRFMLDCRVDVVVSDDANVVLDDNRALFKQRSRLSDNSNVDAVTEVCSADKRTKICPFAVNSRSHNGNTPLLEAIELKHHDIVELLLKNGADLNLNKLENVNAYENPTPLMCATFNHDCDMVLMLLRYGCVDIDNDVYNIASIQGCTDIVTALLRYRSRKDATNPINKTTMFDLFVDNSDNRADNDGLLQNRQENSTETLQNKPPDTQQQIYPTTPVLIDWSGYQTLQNINESSILETALHMNPSLSPASQFTHHAVTSINLSNNSIQILSACLFNLPSLCVLDVSDNLLIEIEVAKITNSPSLHKININHNRLITIPSFVFKLSGLTFIDASYNHITNIPPDIWLSLSLKTADLSHNKLHDIPPPKTGVTNRAPLQTIHSKTETETETNIQNFNREINTHVNIWSKHLKITESNVSTVDKELGITTLNLSFNEFTGIPEGLACLAPNLHNLNLSNNKLDAFGAPVQYPAYLTDLDLSHNDQLMCVKLLMSPEDASTKTGSSHCYRSNRAGVAHSLGSRTRTHSRTSLSSVSSVRSWPSFSTSDCIHRQHNKFGHLTNLNVSYCSKLVLLSGREVSSNSDSMRPLSAAEIQVELLFPVLRCLDLSYTSVRRLPREIGEISNLTSLQLAYTKVTELPGELGLLKQLRHLDLEDCRLSGPIQAMVANKVQPSDIVGFLDSVREESVEYNCMNLMFVGPHGIGKTSLLQLFRKRGYSKQSTKHWAERVSDNFATKKDATLSTVGIDINDLTIDRKEKGPVMFRTWDFGGQKEYYVTHQYFLSPRSLYLVMWKVTSGEAGIRSVVEWLINIQARAPRSYVIIVGTHLDVLKSRHTRDSFPPDFEQSIIRRLRDIVCVLEPEKYGLPNVIMMVNVSCKTEENVSRLLDYIYTQVFHLAHPKSKTTLMLKQKIPKKYLHLQQIVGEIAAERRADGKDPVLSTKLYSMTVMNKMIELTNSVFRDAAELQQATNFLHENGVLFHFTDEHLKDLYFLDPQWLCDQLSKVVTIKDINRYAPNGVMEIAKLPLLFHGFTHNPSNAIKYIVSLLERFEVALPFDEKNIIIPSMLPTELELPACIGLRCDIRIPIRKHSHGKPNTYHLSKVNRTRTLMERKLSLNEGNSTFFSGSAQGKEHMHLDYSVRAYGHKTVKVTGYSNSPMYSLTRLYLMTYFPSGFWPRLITRLLADATFYDVVHNLYTPPHRYWRRRSPFSEYDRMFSFILSEHSILVMSPHHLPHSYTGGEEWSKNLSGAEWRCWRTGVELRYLGASVLWLKEYDSEFPAALCDYSHCELMCVQEGDWAPVDLAGSSIIEVHIPSTSINLMFSHPSPQFGEEYDRTVTVHKSIKTSAQLLAKIVEHVDVLLHDWFPDLGELRLAQNMDGRYLITRLVPCPKCVAGQKSRLSGVNRGWWDMVEHDAYDVFTSVSIDATGVERKIIKPRPFATLQRSKSVSLTPGSDIVYNRDHPESCTRHIYTFMVEACLLLSKSHTHITCPQHGAISPHFVSDGKEIIASFHLVPEIIFQDLPDKLIIPQERLQIGSFIGRGSYGYVFSGELMAVENGVEVLQPVALKLLEPIEINVETNTPNVRHFSSVKALDSSMPLEHATRSYLNARQEVSIHGTLGHRNIVELIGVSLNPLCLVLSMAPMGELSGILDKYQQHQRTLSVFAIRHSIEQVSSGLSYLHSENIIYRDLKSENILVWAFPPPSDLGSTSLVHLKISDYGISRSIAPTGARGFGGSPPFMAPEIIHHGGKDTYTTKVDCFSFGMFIYELLTCHQPFIDYPSPGNLNLLVYQGGRPHISAAVTDYPSYILDLMTLCWSQDARQRPTSQEIHDLIIQPEFCHLLDAVSMETDAPVVATGVINPNDADTLDKDNPIWDSMTPNSEKPMTQVWLSVATSRDISHIQVYSYASNKCCDKVVLVVPRKVVCMCEVSGDMWCIDDNSTLTIFSSQTFNPTFNHKITGLKPKSKVMGMFHASRRREVVILSDVGDLVVYSDSFLDEKVEVFSRVLEPYPGNVFCATLVDLNNVHYELWTGHNDRSICVRDLYTDPTLTTLTHDGNTSPVTSHCVFLVTQCAGVAGAKSQTANSVWSYNYPGSVVYHWDGAKKVVLCQIDVSAIDFDSLGVESSQKTNTNIQVTALQVLNSFLYIGTTSGTIIITMATTLKPITLIHCHGNQDYYIRDLIPFHDSANFPGVLSIGKGYHNLLSKSMRHPSSDTMVRNVDMSINADKRQYLDEKLVDSYGYLLSWLAEDWQHF